MTEQTPRQRTHRRVAEDDKTVMRQMRATGTGVQEIAYALGFSLSVVHRWTKDIHLAKPPKKIKPASPGAVTKLERRERQADDIADAALRKRQQVSLPTTATFTSDDIEWPNEYVDKDYDVTGHSQTNISYPTLKPSTRNG
jgi:hypothetical protein